MSGRVRGLWVTDDREPPGDGPHDRPHAFGPTPSRTPPPAMGFRSNLRLIPSLVPLPGPEDEVEVAEEDEPDDYQPRHALRRDPGGEPPAPTAPAAAEATEASDDLVADDPDPSSGRHRRHASALSGTVRSTRGRGLRGMQVAVLDDEWNVVATTVTGAHGQYVVEDLAAGTYRVTAHDEVDGDFGIAWHDGTSADGAGELRVKPGRTRRRADVVLASTASIDLDIELKAQKAVLRIVVTDRGTGLPATGSVRVRTKQVSTELPLIKGRARLSVLGPADGSDRRAKKVTVDYRGTRHTQRGSASGRLR